MRERSTEMKRTRLAIANTSLVFRRIFRALRRLVFPRLTVFFELVVERLQTYSQNLCGAGLVLSSCLQGSQDQQPFGLIYGCTYAYRHYAGIVNLCGLRGRSAEARRQMARVERSGIRAKNHRSL